MKLIDAYRTDDPVIDRYTFVFDEVDPLTGCNTMLGTDHDGRMFSQWTEGSYDQDGNNAHLGERPRFIGETLVNHLLRRMTEDEELALALDDVLQGADRTDHELH